MHRDRATRQTRLDGFEVDDGESLDGSVVAAGGPGGAAVIHRFGSGLDAKVLVLNKLFMAVRVVSARRAFTLLQKDLA
jgi:hypothetical protein